ncbi:MAG: DUF1810 domain-containing protein [Burkholderiaceae bacterium]|nr:DUF1810 domain-containing protein [Rhodoferax sp.]MCP5270014.1 DUF1810 domain-containing protein [Burkholderiaceae bacterium]
MPPATDLHDLQRFVAAQDPVWDTVAAELQAGDKRSHWMWFVFPQLAVLGRSATARHFGLTGLDDARAYAAHPVLGLRLRAACEWLLQASPGRSSLDILGPPDHLKLRSSMTLFAAAVPSEPLFAAVLARFDGGQPDPLTLEALG